MKNNRSLQAIKNASLTALKKIDGCVSLSIISIAALIMHFSSFINLNMNVIDEMQYILGIKHGISNSAYPSPVYFALYSIIGNELSNLKLLARVINLIIFFIGLYPVYKIALRYTDKYASFFIAVFYLFSPYSWYVNNVMPEILFGTIFYWIIYIVTCKNLNTLNAILLGIGLNILVGVKNHGLFVIPMMSMILYLDYLDKKIEIKNIITLFFVFIVLKIIFDYCIYGEPVLFSKIYSSVLNQPLDINFLGVIKNFFISLFGNVAFLCAFFLIPLLIMFGKNGHILKFSIAVFFGYAIFLLMTILFSVKVSGMPSESISRIHNRYYSFFTPLLFIASFHIINSENKKRYFLILFGSVLAVIFGYLSQKYYIISYIDNTDNNAAFLHPIYLLVLPIGVIFFRKIINIRYYYFFLIILLIFCSIKNGYSSYQFRKNNTPSDFAGIYLCKEYKNNKINIFVDNFVSYGFLYFNCPLEYNVNYFENFKGEIEKDTYYIGNFVAYNPHFFNNLIKISDSMYYAK